MFTGTTSQKAFIAPFAAFLLLLALGDLIGPAAKYWIFPLQTVLCGALVIYFWSRYSFKAPANVGFTLFIAVSCSLPGYCRRPCLASLRDWMDLIPQSSKGVRRSTRPASPCDSSGLRWWSLSSRNILARISAALSRPGKLRVRAGRCIHLALVHRRHRWILSRTWSRRSPRRARRRRSI